MRFPLPPRSPKPSRTKRDNRSSFKPTLEALEERALLSTVSWINPSGGDWDTPSNWSSNAVPGANDAVVINLPGAIVTHSANIADSVYSLTSQDALVLSGGSLSLAAASTINNNFTLDATLISASDIHVTGVLTTSGNPTLAGSGTVYLDGGTAANPNFVDPHGLMTLGCSLVNNGYTSIDTAVYLASGVTFTNTAGATLVNIFARPLAGATGEQFVNNGTFLTQDSGLIAVPFTNNGIVQPFSGPLTLSGVSTQTTTGVLYEQIGGLTAGTQYGQIIVTGSTNLAGALQVALINGFTPHLGDIYTIIKDAGSIPVAGTFAGLAEGATFSSGGYQFQISYAGGSGNDVTLKVVAVYQFSGFLAPLDQNIAFGLNRTIPIKWQLRDASGAIITSLSAITSLKVAPVLSGGGLGTPFSPASSGNTGLHNDGSQYIFNWQTKGLAAGSYEILLTLADGTVRTKVVQLSANGTGGALVVDGSGSATPTVAGALLGGNIELYVDNSNGDLTADELARIQDAVTAVDTVTSPYGAEIDVVTDPTQADVMLNMGTTSAVGGYADGVLGCTTDAGQITFITGWNFYAGSDASQIGSGQYDFQTVVTHELGHALGLGHSADSASVMYSTLNTGMVKHALVTADLNVPDSDTTGACGLHAAGPSLEFRSGSVVVPLSVQPSGVTAPSEMAGRPVLGGQALLTAINVDPHLVAALLDSSLRSPYSTPFLMTSSSTGSISQPPLVSVSSKEAPSMMAWEQRPLNRGESVFADYGSTAEMDELVHRISSETRAECSFLDS
jgi:hypothetical protein